MPRKPKALEAITLHVRVGRNIKAARTRARMTQGELAEAIDVENVTLSRIETGAQLPSLDRLQHIAEVLQLPLQALVADDATMSGLVETMVMTIRDLPEREQEFLLNFVLDYARHWKQGQ
jgi:transcriptional regulator with XRE-family HTH domain